MVNLDNTVYASLNNYFNTLAKTGYVKDCSRASVLLLIFLDMVLEEFNGYITEADYKQIGNIIACMRGTNCLIPYERYILPSTLGTGVLLSTPVFTTEDEDIHPTEGGKLKLQS